MIEQILRAPLPDQFKALLEKLDNDPDASSYEEIRTFLRNYENRLTRYERYVFSRAVRKAGRAYLLDRAMEIVIGVEEDSPKMYRYSSSGKPITAADITRESLKILERNMPGMNAPIKREGERVNY
ncbi:hypothetical protein EBT31_22010 [bacterium]|jgi:hypothetical protein|nr:hypothetical protein [bacterium]NBX50739.1 hypothetical protein [bacterium]